MAIIAALHILPAVLLLAALGLAAQIPCEEVCFTSFDGCESSGGVCTFDHDTYPNQDPAGSGPVSTIFVGFDYTVAWKDADPTFPLRISWHFVNDTAGFYDIRWAHEIRAPSQVGTWTWNAREVLKDFPTPYANVTGLEAFAYASTREYGHFGISQPEKSNRNDAVELSDPFMLQSQAAAGHAISAQYSRGSREVEERWRLGVGIGVGLGVPLLIALFWVIGYRQGKKGSWNWMTHVPKA